MSGKTWPACGAFHRTECGQVLCVQTSHARGRELRTVGGGGGELAEPASALRPRLIHLRRYRRSPLAERRHRCMFCCRGWITELCVANKDGDLIPMVRCFEWWLHAARACRCCAAGSGRLLRAARARGCYALPACHQALAADKGTTMASTSLA